MDLGVAQAVYDAPMGADLGTIPMFNSSIGLAWRMGAPSPPPRPLIDR
jgi:hypothetical protein